MARAPYVAAVVSLAFVFSACGGSDTGTPVGPASVQTRTPDPNPTVGQPPPATPTPAPTPAPAPPTASVGTIKLVSVSPDPGTSLTVQSCIVNGLPRDCAAWSGTFEVTASEAVEWPVLTVGFYDGTKSCGYAAATIGAALPAGIPTTFRPSFISLTDEFGTLNPPCSLPAKATRLVVEVWTDANWSFSLRQEFPIHYNFVKP